MKQLAEIMSSLNEVVTRLVQYLQQQTTARDVTHNAKHLNVNVETSELLHYIFLSVDVLVIFTIIALTVICVWC